MNKILFLDRDGVVNRAIVREGRPYPPQNLSELSLMDGIHRVCAEFKKHSYFIVVVTNQPDLARKQTSWEWVETIHQKIQSELPIDEVLVCPHDDADNCQCRKPRPGLILQALKKYSASPPNCLLIGDRWRDIEAAKQAAVRSVWLDGGYREKLPVDYDFKINGLEQVLDVAFGDLKARRRG